MREDRKKWNQKYRDKNYSSLPSGMVERFFSLARPGRALDIACGIGKNSIFLGKKGFSVDAVDISDEALKELSGTHPGINPICADLDNFDIPKGRYSLIINIRFLSRRLFPYICEGLVPGGILIFESYIKGKGDDYCKTHNPDYLLRENELLRSFLGLKILYYNEIREEAHDEPFQTASLIAEKI